MFNFMKKGVGVGDDRDEKERRKREKKMRKEGKGTGVSGSMSTEELLRLDEVSLWSFLTFKVKKNSFMAVL